MSFYLSNADTHPIGFEPLEFIDDPTPLAPGPFGSPPATTPGERAPAPPTPRHTWWRSLSAGLGWTPKRRLP